MSNSVFSNDWAILNGYTGGEDEVLSEGNSSPSSIEPGNFFWPEVYPDPGYLCYEHAMLTVSAGTFAANTGDLVSLHTIAEAIVNNQQAHLLLGGTLTGNFKTRYVRMIEALIHRVNLLHNRSYPDFIRFNPHITFHKDQNLLVPNVFYPSESTVNGWIEKYNIEDSSEFFYRPNKEGFIVSPAMGLFPSNIRVDFTRNPSSDWDVIGVLTMYGKMGKQPQFIYGRPKYIQAGTNVPSWQQKIYFGGRLPASILYLRPFLYASNYLKAVADLPTETRTLFRPPNVFEILRFLEELFTMSSEDIDFPNWGWFDRNGPKPHFPELIGTFFSKYLPIFIESRARRGETLEDDVISVISEQGTFLQPLSSQSIGSMGLIVGAVNSILRGICMVIQSVGYYGTQFNSPSPHILEDELTSIHLMVRMGTQVYQEGIDGLKSAEETRQQILGSITQTVFSVLSVFFPEISLLQELLGSAILLIAESVSGGVDGAPKLEKSLQDFINKLIDELTVPESLLGEITDLENHVIEGSRKPRHLYEAFAEPERKLMRDELKSMASIIEVNH